jgi:hypothetical protein
MNAMMRLPAQRTQSHAGESEKGGGRGEEGCEEDSKGLAK